MVHAGNAPHRPLLRFEAAHESELECVENLTPIDTDAAAGAGGEGGLAADIRQPHANAGAALPLIRNLLRLGGKGRARGHCGQRRANHPIRYSFPCHRLSFDPRFLFFAAFPPRSDQFAPAIIQASRQ